MASPHGQPGAPTIVARPAGQRLLPLSFPIPTGTARLLRWLVAPGQPFQEGEPLARVRIPAGTVWDLVAHTPGTLDEVLVPGGRDVHSGEWLALVRSG